MEKPSWILLEHSAQLDDIVRHSFLTPCLIFKHSTKCFISSVALKRLEESWSLPDSHLIPFFLDAIKNRKLSKQISEIFSETHETPQILLIKKGECILEATDMDIHMKEIQEMVSTA
ncbi:MAG: bacillithiol system protein YtxJ [Saprospiraceae bacterium]